MVKNYRLNHVIVESGWFQSSLTMLVLAQSREHQHCICLQSREEFLILKLASSRVLLGLTVMIHSWLEEKIATSTKGCLTPTMLSLVLISCVLQRGREIEIVLFWTFSISEVFVIVFYFWFAWYAPFSHSNDTVRKVYFLSKTVLSGTEKKYHWLIELFNCFTSSSRWEWLHQEHYHFEICKKIV